VTTAPEARDPHAFNPVAALIIIAVVGLVVVISIIGLFFVGDADVDDANVALTIDEYLDEIHDEDVEKICELENRPGEECEAEYERAFAESEDIEFEELDISDIQIDEDQATASVSVIRKVGDEENECNDAAFALERDPEDDEEWFIVTPGACA
jgi:hypothetical protein